MIENCAIATMDGPRHDQGGTEYRSGHITVTGGRITAVGEGPARSVPDGARRIDAAGCLATPGLVNTHHHLYQWLTQGRALAHRGDPVAGHRDVAAAVLGAALVVPRAVHGRDRAVLDHDGFAADQLPR